MDNNDYIYCVTDEEWQKVARQPFTDYDIIKTGDDPHKWYYQVYFYDALMHLVAIKKYRYLAD